MIPQPNPGEEETPNPDEEETSEINILDIFILLVHKLIGAESAHKNLLGEEKQISSFNLFKCVDDEGDENDKEDGDDNEEECDEGSKAEKSEEIQKPFPERSNRNILEIISQGPKMSHTLTKLLTFMTSHYKEDPDYYQSIGINFDNIFVLIIECSEYDIFYEGCNEPRRRRKKTTV
jgi:hypothetical protein